jgi:stearoyl-CoA desaturase (Delta-9 desaturase)
MAHSWLAGALGASFWTALAASLLLTHATILSVTLYLHRGVAHRAVAYHPALARAFRIWLWMSTGMSTLEWAAVHRKHHARCETPEDPHSPQQKGIWRVLLAGAWLYTQEASNAETLARYGRGAPDDRMESFFRRHSVLGLVLMALIDLGLFGGWGVFVFLVQIAWIPFWAAGVVNGIGHFWGYRNFDSPDQSRNISPWGILIGGEELHNNHHAFPASAKLSCRKGEFDWGWTCLRGLEALGLATVKRAARAPALAGERSAVDRGLLDALLAHRHHAQADLRRALTPYLRERFAQAREAAGGALAGARFSQFRAWFFQESARQPRAHWAERFEAIAHADALLAQARASALSLRNLWELSHASADELVERLRQWAREAEAHPVEGVRAFWSRLSRYQAAAA